MKKKISLLLFLSLVLVLFVSCGEKQGEDKEGGDSQENNVSEPESDDSENTEDNSPDVTDGIGEKVTDGVEELQIGKSGFFFEKVGTYNNLYYAVEITNPNENADADIFNFVVTVKDENGQVLSTKEDIVKVAANDKLLVGGGLDYDGADPVTVEFTKGAEETQFIKAKSSTGDFYIPRTGDFTVSNFSMEAGDFETTFTCDITNNMDFAKEYGDVYIIFKSGDEIVGGTITSLENAIDAGATVPFKLEKDISFKGFDSVEVIPH